MSMDLLSSYPRISQVYPPDFIASLPNTGYPSRDWLFRLLTSKKPIYVKVRDNLEDALDFAARKNCLNSDSIERLRSHSQYSHFRSRLDEFRLGLFFERSGFKVKPEPSTRKGICDLLITKDKRIVFYTILLLPPCQDD